MAEKKNVIKDLIETGKRNGKVTTKEISDALEEIGFDVVEQVDKLYEMLESHNIEIVDEPDPEVEEFKLTEENTDQFEGALAAEGVSIDDPVKV
ncbi:MAG: RNA polymerase sigma factor region1.1 domain-containing protein, partial [Pygmaiobacter massiliensis]